MAEIRIRMTREKETKNKVVYRNLDGVIDTVYVDKSQLRNHLEGQKGFPEQITLVVQF